MDRSSKDGTDEVGVGKAFMMAITDVKTWLLCGCLQMNYVSHSSRLGAGRMLMYRSQPPSPTSSPSLLPVSNSTERPLSPSPLHPTSYVSSPSPSTVGTLTRSKNEPFILSAHSSSRSSPTSSPSPPPRSHLDTSPCVSCPHPSTQHLSLSCLGSLRP